MKLRSQLFSMNEMVWISICKNACLFICLESAQRVISFTHQDILFFLALTLKLKIGSQQRKQRQTKKRFASLSKWTINVSRWIDLRKTAKMVQNGVRSYLKNHLFSYICHGRFMMWKNTRKNWQRWFSYLLEVWIAEMCKKFHNGFLRYQQDQQDLCHGHGGSCSFQFLFFVFWSK